MQPSGSLSSDHLDVLTSRLNGYVELLVRIGQEKRGGDGQKSILVCIASSGRYYRVRLGSQEVCQQTLSKNPFPVWAVCLRIAQLAEEHGHSVGAADVELLGEQDEDYSGAGAFDPDTRLAVGVAGFIDLDYAALASLILDSIVLCLKTNNDWLLACAEG
jgi:hypothetical protein